LKIKKSHWVTFSVAFFYTVVGRVGIEPIAALTYGAFNTTNNRKRGDSAEATNTTASLRRRQKAT